MSTFSLSQMKKVHNFEFHQGSGKDYEAGYIFSTKFSNDGNYIFAGGAGRNEFKVFANNSDTSADYKI